MKYLTLLAGCFIFLAACSTQGIAQQTTDPRNFGTPAPIKLTTLTLNTGQSRTALRRANNWLAQPLVQVENTSANAIEYLVIEVSFPGIESGPLMLGYGQTPGHKSFLKVTEPLQPGKKVSLSVSRNTCDAVQSRLLASGISPASGSGVSARINAVVFTNKTAWFDGLLHVPEPNNPLQWNVAQPTRADASSATPLFNFVRAGYRLNLNPRSSPAPCWKRIGTEWRDCCGLQVASAILANVWGGILEPFPMSSQCEDGSYCEWIKAVGCSNDPTGGW
jgi:hypothetical protein